MVGLAPPLPAEPPPLTTRAEQSGYRQTGRYAEVERLCTEFARAWPRWVRVEKVGVTPEGRVMWALVASRRGRVTPETAAAHPVVLVQGGIHAGEIDGKDAGFEVLRQWLQSPGPLDTITLVFVPVFNVDGHERFGPWNRPNQVGPEEMGWRVTAQNLNLNRDYAKVDSPEMAAMLALLRRWDPILYVDLHVTDGSHFQPNVATLVEPIYVGDPHLQPVGRQLQKETNDLLRQSGAMPLDFYPSLRDHRDPASGFDQSAYTPRFSTGYWALHNRLAMLVETHSWKPYAERVAITRWTLQALGQLAAAQGQAWKAVARQADQDSSRLGGQAVALSYKTGEAHHWIDFPGVAYRHEPSRVSGGQALRYFPDQPQTWHIPFYDQVLPDRVVSAPRGGYWIPPAQAGWMTPKLRNHGLVFRRLGWDLPARPVEVFRAERVSLSRRTSEGHTLASLEGKWQSESHPLPRGGLFVPIQQPRARLVMALLEPQAPDSFASWGFFNACFEQKEYMEEYVAEEVGQSMLEQDPLTAAAFAERLASDPAFAKDPAARLDFFYRRHSSWDQRQNLYPILRCESAPP